MATTLQLPVEGHLPSFEGATGWINSDLLTPENLRGRPVVVEFWTFTCINWLRTLPYVRAWFERYRDDGLVVIGVHTPEFDVERDVERVRVAAREMRIEFPIAVDSEYRVWRAFDNNYWPALYFADADGQIRHHRFGEGEYESSEMVIQRLLAAADADQLRVSREPVAADADGAEAPADWDHLRSGEAYIGYVREEGFASPGGIERDGPQVYALPEVLRLNQWGLFGDWTVGGQPAVLNAPGGGIAHRFHARDLHLVLAPPPDDRPVRFRVRLDGAAPGADHGVDLDEHGEGTVNQPRLYQLIRQRGRVADRTFEITFLDADVRAYVFTFG